MIEDDLHPNIDGMFDSLWNSSIKSLYYFGSANQPANNLINTNKAGFLYHEIINVINKEEFKRMMSDYVSQYFDKIKSAIKKLPVEEQESILRYFSDFFTMKVLDVFKLELERYVLYSLVFDELHDRLVDFNPSVANEYAASLKRIKSNFTIEGLNKLIGEEVMFIHLFTSIKDGDIEGLKANIKEVEIKKITKENPETKLFLYAQFEYFEKRKGVTTRKYKIENALIDANSDPRCNYCTPKYLDEHYTDIYQRFRSWKSNYKICFDEWRKLFN